MEQELQKVQVVVIGEDNHLQRIDNFLTTSLKGVPKGKIYKILRKGEVRVNKKRVKPEYKLQIDDIVRIPPIRLATEADKAKPSHNALETLEASIIFEDDRILVINKPSGFAVHGGSGINYGVIEGLRALRPNSHFLELVHRLDRDTSGCLVIAKKRSALRHLHEQLRNNRMNKIYHALVLGEWQKTCRQVDLPLAKNLLKGGERMVKVDEEGKPSLTKFRLLSTNGDMSLVQAKPVTGRTHQIRVHCQVAGHPIANDSKYGDKQFDEMVKRMGCSRLCLHAYQIQFTHPSTEQMVSFEAPYDQAFNNAVKAL